MLTALTAVFAALLAVAGAGVLVYAFRSALPGEQVDDVLLFVG